MDAPRNNIIGFAGSLGLIPVGDLFVGKRGGFPIGLKIVDPDGSVLLLFQVRHWLKADAPQIKSLSYGGEVAEFVAAKKIDIEFDDRIAWLTMIDMGPSFTSERVAALLDPILKAFSDAGLIGDPDLCHYCQKEKVSELTSSDGKVAQICNTCLAERGAKNRTPGPAAEAVPIFLMTPAAALVGAILWAGFWIGHTLFFESQGGTVSMPTLLFVLLMMVAAVLGGGPVGWIIKQNRRRGEAVSSTAAVVFSLLAVFTGELLHLVWFIFHQFHVVSFSVALKVMPNYYMHNDSWFQADKFMSVLFAVAFAVMIAKPEGTKLKL